jgi:hypothetical protein
MNCRDALHALCVLLTFTMCAALIKRTVQLYELLYSGCAVMAAAAGVQYRSGCEELASAMWANMVAGVTGLMHVMPTAGWHWSFMSSVRCP